MSQPPGSKKFRYLELFEKLRDGVVTVDVDGKITECNPAFERITGYSAQELALLSYQEFTPEKWHAYEEKIVREQILKHGYSEVYEKEYRRKDGTIVPIELQAYVVRDDSGRFLGMQGVVRDISERKRAEESLRKSEEQFRLLFEYAPVGIALYTFKGKLERTNSAYQRMLGYSEQELAQLRVEDITHPEDLNKTFEQIERIAAGKSDNYQIEKRFVRKDGSVFWGKGSGSAVRDETGRPEFAVGVLVDISDQKQAFMRETRARQEAEKTVQLRDEFLMLASHELRTPLTPLTAGIQFLRKLVEKVSPVCLEKEDMFAALKINDLQVKRLRRMVELMLLTSRIDAGQLILTFVPCDLSEIVHETLKQYQLELGKSGSPLRLDLADGVQGNWDRDLLQQTLGVLLENAMKFGAGQPIEITTALLDRRAKVSVRDHGIGLTKTDQNRLFERFERGVSVQLYGGLGLGLYIAKEIVEAQGGTIRCESSSGKGATFTIELPVDRQN